MHGQGWRGELTWVLAGLLLLTLAGLFLGQTSRLLEAGLVVYLAWHLFQLYRFSRWVKSPKHYLKPFSWGVWSELVGEVEALRDKGRKRKRKLRRMLSGIMESTRALPDATLVLNSDDQIEWWNKAAAALLRLERKRNKDCPIESHFKDPVFLSYLQAGNYARPLHMPAPMNPSINLEVRIAPYGKGKRLLQARDITRLNQLEVVRRDFVANVSHEMRTPLTVVNGYLEMLHESAAVELADWHDIFGTMREQTSRMQHIVEDLLLLSRLEGRERVDHQGVVKVSAILHNILIQAGELSGEDQHQIELETDERICLVGNDKELQSAFSNLVFNAIRYTPAGGQIKVRWWLSGEGPCFAVSDTGIGIDPKHIPRLTERFYRVDVGRSRDRGGTGLGLAIVKHVLNRHDGQLEIRSQRNSGSSFICHFPHQRLSS